MPAIGAPRRHFAYPRGRCTTRALAAVALALLLTLLGSGRAAAQSGDAFLTVDPEVFGPTKASTCAGWWEVAASPILHLVEGWAALGLYTWNPDCQDTDWGIPTGVIELQALLTSPQGRSDPPGHNPAWGWTWCDFLGFELGLGFDPPWDYGWYVTEATAFIEAYRAGVYDPTLGWGASDGRPTASCSTIAPTA